MSPEYAADGLFSVKSDVFSFGVLVMEIVSGKKNRGFFHQDHLHNLLGHVSYDETVVKILNFIGVENKSCLLISFQAWRLYKEGKSLELMDVSVGNSWCESEVLRSIQVGLLCSQQHLEDRPYMSSVVTMLDGDGAVPQPKQPGFFTDKSVHEVECSPSRSAQYSINEATFTELDAR